MKLMFEIRSRIFNVDFILKVNIILIKMFKFNYKYIYIC